MNRIFVFAVLSAVKATEERNEHNMQTLHYKQYITPQDDATDLAKRKIIKQTQHSEAFSVKVNKEPSMTLNFSVWYTFSIKEEPTRINTQALMRYKRKHLQMSS